jgi:hypothetical protein
MSGANAVCASRTELDDHFEWPVQDAVEEVHQCDHEGKARPKPPPRRSR